MKRLSVCIGAILALGALAGCGSSDGGAGDASGGDRGMALGDAAGSSDGGGATDVSGHPDVAYVFDVGTGPAWDAAFVAECPDGGWCHEPGLATCESNQQEPRADEACAAGSGATGFCCLPCWIPPDAGRLSPCGPVSICTPMGIECGSGYRESPVACTHCNPARCCVPDEPRPCDQPGEIFHAVCDGGYKPWCTCSENKLWVCKEQPCG